MTDHLDDISTYYFLDPEDNRKTKAISKVDAEIVNTILQIFARTGESEVFGILNKWKKIPDSEILDKLENLVFDDETFKNRQKAKAGDGFFEKLLERMQLAYIKIGDHQIQANKIFVVSNETSHDGHRSTYSIVINKEQYLPTGHTSWYTDLKVDFFSEEERQIELIKIKKLITQNTMCKFLN